MARWRWEHPDTRVFPYHELFDGDGGRHPVCEPGDEVFSDDDVSVVGFTPVDDDANKLADREPERAEESDAAGVPQPEGDEPTHIEEM